MEHLARIVNSYNWNKEFRRELEQMYESGLLRTLKNLRSEEGDLFISVNDSRVLNLNSNDYLNLAGHPKVKKAASLALEKYGSGSGSARLLSGGSEIHAEFENEISQIHGTERALVFGSGYMANLGVLESLSSQVELILADKLNHASLIDGMRLSGTAFSRYRHMDMDHLESLLQKSKSPDRCLVASETLFSMDGDFAPLEPLFQLQKKYGFFLYLDEAHSFGGYPEYLEIIKANINDRMLIMGTLGKALGSFGSFVTGTGDCIEFLVNHARPFMFSTSLPAHLLSASLAAMRVIEQEPERHQELHNISIWLSDNLKKRGVDTLQSKSHIIPALAGTSARASRLAANLFQQGYYCLPIRPPTVSEGTCRLRISLSCGMKREHFENLLSEVGLWK